MLAINPYLFFPGTAEEAFNFYKSVFGGEFIMVQRIGDTPESHKFTDAEKEKIMHIALPLGKGNVLMASDMVQSMSGPYIPGNNFTISIGTGSEEEADKMYNGLAQGGKSTMPMQKTFWGSYFGMLVDRFGIHWMVSFDHERPQ